jgi:hypothetical protein
LRSDGGWRGWLPVSTEQLVPDLATVAAGFATLLRASGIAATPERSARFASAVELGRPASVSELYWLARVTLVDRADGSVPDPAPLPWFPTYLCLAHLGRTRPTTRGPVF